MTPGASLPAVPRPATPVFDRQRWPQRLALRHRALLARDEQGRARLVADRDADALLLQAAELRLGEPLGWQACQGAELQAWLDQGESDGRALDELSALDAAGPAAAAGTGPEAAAGTGPEALGDDLSLGSVSHGGSAAVRLVDAVLIDALADGASDIHLECVADGARLRLRIDGVMQPLRAVQGRELAGQMVSRLKVLAGLDIGERRLPQDGRFAQRVQGRAIDFRLSIMPSVHGEDAVLRVLDRQHLAQGPAPIGLAALGLDAGLREQLLRLARRPHGMLLVAGPTGSGKTTTLYAAIAEVHGPGEKFITIEDPVEYQLDGVVQIPVNERQGLSFARGLRSILRHDPDRVMVGEIRDAETAQFAVQAALTGHQVFSTLHANTAFDAIGRFMHLGLDLYNLVAALNAVLGQRLVRRVCPQCAVPLPADEAAAVRAQLRVATAAAAAAAAAPHAADPDPDADAAVAAVAADRPPHRSRLSRGRGCAHCHHSGYRGRLALAELLALDDGLRELIVARAPMSEIRRRARSGGMRSLLDAAHDAVRQGQTTLEEINRVVVET